MPKFLQRLILDFHIFVSFNKSHNGTHYGSCHFIKTLPRNKSVFPPVIIFSYQYPDKSRSGNLNPIYLSNFEYEESCIEQTDRSQVFYACLFQLKKGEEVVCSPHLGHQIDSISVLLLMDSEL